MTIAEQIVAHLCGEPTHETWLGKHYPSCPGCDTTRWHYEGCALNALLDEHREAVDAAYKRVADVVEHAVEMLRRYDPESLR